MTDSLPVTIILDSAGRGSIRVGGIDLSNHVEGLNLIAHPGDHTRLHLTLSKVAIELDANIQIDDMPEATQRLVEIVGDMIAAHAAEGDPK